MTIKKKPSQTVQSLTRAFDIIEELVEYINGLGVTELSKKLDLHKSTVHRLLATLEYRGYVKKDNGSNKYKLSMKFLDIGGELLDDLDLRREVKPHIRRLGDETGETIHLGILVDYEVIYIDKEETPQTIRMYSKIGASVPAHCTSMGKILLAYSPENVLEELLKKKGLPKKTKNTITDEKKLRKHLKKVKENGYAVDNQEMETNIRCIAGPIFNFQNKILGSFSISGPTSRITKDRIEELAELVKLYSKEMSALFGYKKR